MAAAVRVESLEAVLSATPPAAPMLAGDATHSQNIEHVAGADVAVSLSWDFFEGTEPVDLDASALVFDEFGVLLDAAFYNQLVCMDGALVHSGDCVDGVGDGVDEAIHVDVDALPAHAHLVVVLVNAYKGGSFAHVETAHCTVTGCEGFDIGCSGDHTGLLLFALHRQSAEVAAGGSDGSAQWQIRRFGEAGFPCAGVAFDESLPAVRAAMGSAGLLDPVLLAERCLSEDRSFAMGKGDCVTIPADLFQGGDDFFVGLGWSCGPNIDLDASVIVCDGYGGGRAINVVAFNDTEFGSAVQHQGDNQTGDGDGDDETILIDLDAMPDAVRSCFVVVNIYSAGRTFGDVHDAYIRLVSCKTHRELARYALHDGLDGNGVVFAKIRRAPSASGLSREWQLCTIGDGCEGAVAGSEATMGACHVTGWLGGSPHSAEIAAIECTAHAARAVHKTLGRSLSQRAFQDAMRARDSMNQQQAAQPPPPQGCCAVQ
jgi:stress response protein SCP2